MSFLAPILLWGLLAISLPILIHLLNRFRHRTVDWGAMMFLREAARRTRGRSRLRHLLIMACRMLALAALFLGVARPLAGGLLGSWSAQVDTAVIVLDRSPSTARIDSRSGQPWRENALQRIADALDTMGQPAHLVLIESGSTDAQVLPSMEALFESPEIAATDAESDLPTLLEEAARYLEANDTGRAELWVVSDAQRGDWRADSERWPALRRRFAEREIEPRFHVFSPDPPTQEDLSVRVEGVRHLLLEGSATLELDLVVRRRGDDMSSKRFPLGIVVDGARTVVDLNLEGDLLRLENHRVPLDAQRESGHGWVELPRDSNPRNDVFYFAYGQQTMQRALMVMEEQDLVRPTALALSPPNELGRSTSRLATPEEVGQLDLAEFSCIVWQAALPVGSAAVQVERFLDLGGSLLFLPPREQNSNEFLGFGWSEWQEADDVPFKLPRWRDDAGLLRHSQSGAPLPVVELECARARGLRIPAAATVLAHRNDGEPWLARLTTNRGNAHFLGTWPSEPSSNLARHGIVWFVLLQRLREEGGERLARATAVDAGTPLADASTSLRLDGFEEGAFATQRFLVAGVDQIGERLIARNRPLAEDVEPTLEAADLRGLLDGLDVHLVEDAGSGSSALVEEIWRLFVGAMALFLLGEALLCLPQRWSTKLALSPEGRS